MKVMLTITKQPLLQMRKLKINDKIWKYAIHTSVIEIRNPDNKKVILGYADILPYDELEIDEDIYYNNSLGIEYTLYRDLRDGSYFSRAKIPGSFNQMKVDYFFALTPSRIKKFIINNPSKFKMGYYKNKKGKWKKQGFGLGWCKNCNLKIKHCKCEIRL